MPSAVRFDHVAKAFGPVRALDGVSLDIAAGETVALLGPNGAGNSTAIGVMPGLRRPDAGTATTLGADPATAVRGGRIGAMLQRAALPPGAKVGELVDGVASLLQPEPCRILILTTFGRPGYLRRAMESGAAGFLLKDAPAAELAIAIRRAAAGGRRPASEWSTRPWPQRPSPRATAPCRPARPRSWPRPRVAPASPPSRVRCTSPRARCATT